MLVALAMFAQAVVGATPYDVTVPNAIVGLHNAYVRCVDRNFDIRRVNSRAAMAAEVERAIAACAAEKAVLKQRAEPVLAAQPDYADASVRAGDHRSLRRLRSQPPADGRRGFEVESYASDREAPRHRRRQAGPRGGRRMNAARTCLALVAPALLAGCVSDAERSYRRWDGYRSGPSPYTRWAFCIGERSGHYLAPESPPVEGNRSQLFTRVLADCREHMAGPAWDNLSDEQRRQLIDDAYREFHRADLDIMMQREMAVI